MLTIKDPLFIGFFRYLVCDECFTPRQLLGVIDRPDRWTPEFEEWKKSQSQEAKVSKEVTIAMHDAYQQGARASRASNALDSNPYTEGTDEHRYWKNGWVATPSVFFG